MYNPEIKGRFIKEYSTKDSIRTICLKTFNKLEPFEESWGADFCTQKEEVILPALNAILGARAEGQRTRSTILREYVKWCMANGIPGACDSMYHVDTTRDISKIREQTVKNPAHLQRLLDGICLPVESNTVDIIIRGFVWLAYSGIAEEDIFKILDSDIDFANMVIHYQDRDYLIYREAIPALTQCVKLQTFTVYHPNYAVPMAAPRVGGHQLLRGTKSDASLKNMKAILSKRMKENKASDTNYLKLSYHRIWLSGVFYRMHEQELAGIPPDFSGIAEERMGDKEYSNKAYNRHRLAKSFMTDYQRWKQSLL